MANQKYVRLARAYAKQFGVDPNVFQRQINAESGFNPRSTSSAGAQGIAQFMPATARSEGVDVNSVRSSLRGAARLDAKLIKQLGYRKGLAAYNAGPGNIGAGLGYADSILSGQHPGGSPNPKGSPSNGGGASGASTVTIPGVDRSSDRKRLIAQYLLQGGVSNPSAIDQVLAQSQQLAGSLNQIAQTKDTPARTVNVGGGGGGRGRAVTGGAISRGALGRTDQGVDFVKAGLVPSPDSGRITKVVPHGGSSGWPGGGQVVIQLDHPVIVNGRKVRHVYLTEDIAPKVRVGQRVRAGQALARALGTGSFLEYGFAADANGTTLARALGHADLHPNHSNTPEGQAFKHYLGL